MVNLRCFPFISLGFVRGHFYTSKTRFALDFTRISQAVAFFVLPKTISFFSAPEFKRVQKLFLNKNQSSVAFFVLPAPEFKRIQKLFFEKWEIVKRNEYDQMSII